jgi:hypothetical protein
VFIERLRPVFLLRLTILQIRVGHLVNAKNEPKTYTEDEIINAIAAGRKAAVESMWESMSLRPATAPEDAALFSGSSAAALACAVVDVLGIERSKLSIADMDKRCPVNISTS